MMDNSSSDPLPSGHTSSEIIFLEFEGRAIKEASDGDYGDAYHDRYCLEMFRRALKERNQGAQSWLQHHFSAVVLDWLHSHPRRVLACSLHTEDYYVIQAFKRCWQTSLHRQDFEFKSMADVLFYLRVSLNGVILDELRSYSRPGRAPLLKSVVARESIANDDDSCNEVWSFIEGKLSDARERRLAYLLFHCALKPVEIVRICSQEFNDVREVSHMRRDIMKLLSQ
jgi:hypothetical protein